MRKAFVIVNQVAVAIASLTYLITCLANLPVVGQDSAQITRSHEIPMIHKYEILLMVH